MNPGRQRLLCCLFLIAMLLPGTLVAGAYYLVVGNTDLRPELADTATIALQTACDTLVLILYPLIFTGLLQVWRNSHHRILVRYKRDGYYAIFIFLTLFTCIHLGWTAFLALHDAIRLSLPPQSYRILLISTFCNNLTQAAMVLIVIRNILHKIGARASE